MPIPLSTLVSDANISPLRQITSEEGGVGLGGTKSTTFFGRLRQGVVRFLNRDNIRQQNAAGIRAYLEELGRHDVDFAIVAANELRGRVLAGKPLTVRKIREIGQGLVTNTAIEKANTLLHKIEHPDPETFNEERALSDLEDAKDRLEFARNHFPASDVTGTRVLSDLMIRIDAKIADLESQLN